MFKSLYFYYLKHKKPLKYLKKVGATVGKKTLIIGPVNVTEGRMLKIGNNCNLSVNVSFYTHDGSNVVSEHLGLSKEGHRICAPIIVGNNVFIGGNTIILPGVEIGNNVIIGAGSVVTKSIPSNVVVGGNPAKIISTTENFFKKNIPLYISPEDALNSNWENSTYKKQMMDF